MGTPQGLCCASRLRGARPWGAHLRQVGRRLVLPHIYNQCKPRSAQTNQERRHLHPHCKPVPTWMISASFCSPAVLLNSPVPVEGEGAEHPNTTREGKALWPQEPPNSTSALGAVA